MKGYQLIISINLMQTKSHSLLKKGFPALAKIRKWRIITLLFLDRKSSKIIFSYFHFGLTQNETKSQSKRSPSRLYKNDDFLRQSNNRMTKYFFKTYGDFKKKSICLRISFVIRLRRKRLCEKSIILAFTALAGPPDGPRPTLAYSLIISSLYSLRI